MQKFNILKLDSVESFKKSAYQSYKKVKTNVNESGEMDCFTQKKLELILETPYYNSLTIDDLRESVQLKHFLNATAYQWGYDNWRNLKRNLDSKSIKMEVRTWTGIHLPARMINFYEKDSPREALKRVTRTGLKCFDSDKVRSKDFIGLSNDEIVELRRVQENIELCIWLRFDILDIKKFKNYREVEMNQILNGKFRERWGIKRLTRSILNNMARGNDAGNIDFTIEYYISKQNIPSLGGIINVWTDSEIKAKVKEVALWHNDELGRLNNS